MNPKERIFWFFTYSHLPPHLQEASRPFHALAKTIVHGPTDGPETTVALRKLLEAKDCYVRAYMRERGDQGHDDVALGGTD